jgi:tRNA pseudouridine13 synthase
VLSLESLLRDWPRAGGETQVSAELRSANADFQVDEELSFEADGSGEHALLQIEKNGLNTQDVVQRLARLSGRAERDIGFSGLKDRHAITCQWFSVGMAGASEPDWGELNCNELAVKTVQRHQKKLRRGVHRQNNFKIVLRKLRGDIGGLERRLQVVAEAGVPNYFGEQRFGIDGNNVVGGLAWMRGEARAPRRQRKGFLLSALRSALFNETLAQRVNTEQWSLPLLGDRCQLRGSASHFLHDGTDPEITTRSEEGDISLALPLWGRSRGEPPARNVGYEELCQFLEEQGLSLDYRAARLFADDFCWRFCDDETLQLEFSLPRGGFATAVLRELVAYNDISRSRGEKFGD